VISVWAGAKYHVGILDIPAATIGVECMVMRVKTGIVVYDGDAAIICRRDAVVGR
jgi:hypothetical protein